MGNRAIITTKDEKIGIYLHWNGGRDTIEPLLHYCDLKGYRSPNYDNYGWARICQVMSNYFGGNTDIGIETGSFDASNYDNGIYYIKDWKIIERKYPYNSFEEQNEHDFKEMLKDLDNSMPKHEQIGEIILNYKQISDPKTLKLGNVIYLQNRNSGDYEEYTVCGFGSDELVSGQNVKNAPIINRFTDENGVELSNINNYLYTNDNNIFLKEEN